MVEALFKFLAEKEKKAVNEDNPHWAATAFATGVIQGAVDVLVLVGLGTGVKLAAEKVKEITAK